MDSQQYAELVSAAWLTVLRHAGLEELPDDREVRWATDEMGNLLLDQHGHVIFAISDRETVHARPGGREVYAYLDEGTAQEQVRAYREGKIIGSLPPRDAN